MILLQTFKCSKNQNIRVVGIDSTRSSTMIKNTAHLIELNIFFRAFKSNIIPHSLIIGKTHGISMGSVLINLIINRIEVKNMPKIVNRQTRHGFVASLAADKTNSNQWQLIKLWMIKQKKNYQREIYLIHLNSQANIKGRDFYIYNILFSQQQRFLKIFFLYIIHSMEWYSLRVLIIQPNNNISNLFVFLFYN